MKRVAFLMSMVFASWSASAGPEWPEVGDAGSLPGSAQPTEGMGALTKITGRLEGPQGLPSLGEDDFQDMYLINIVNPNQFRASTVIDDGGIAAFNSHLWLIRADERALLGTLGFPPDPNGARLLRFSTGETGAGVKEPGLYYLAISSVGSIPLGGIGPGPMFNFGFPGEISGPDGVGGMMNPIVDWTDGVQFGVYEIVLNGVALIEPDCPADLTGNGVLDFFDVQLFLSFFANDDVIADWNGDGLFDFFDVLLYLNDFAAGCP